ncbi:histidine phosphatase family protein [Saccharopolyspora sp. CA-218241]|uniref:histidine phosphatase family protein n=1 Tax=Saccharopolyspora sp. CA-218241 TaxID=3240027 RepID=UPI003D99C484
MVAREQRIYLLRHGSTEWSQDGRHTSRTDLPLTPGGEQQARRVGPLLTALADGPADVLVSPRVRARRTAELAGLTGPRTEHRLVEWDYGDYEGLTTPAIREQVPGWTVWTHPCPGGETAADVAYRADDLLAELRQNGGDAVLVGHGHFSRVLIARWLGLPAAAGVHFALDAAGITVLGHERGTPQLVRGNVPVGTTER